MMTLDVEVLLKGTDEVVTETVTCDGPEPAAWTDTDVYTGFRPRWRARAGTTGAPLPRRAPAGWSALMIPE